MLRPFFSFFGSKWRLGSRYPRPEHQVLVEPFAGSAGYAMHHPGRRVVLCDADPIVAGVWRYLLRATEREVLALPDLEAGQTVAELAVSQEAGWLIGFWLGKAPQRPRLSPSAWMRAGRWAGFWGSAVRVRIARQLASVRHWQIHEADYRNAPVRGPATWFIDPPYAGRPGASYRRGSGKLDCGELGRWCRTRRGLTIVCEQAGADWLPFRPLAESRGVRGRWATELVFVRRDEQQLELELA